MSETNALKEWMAKATPQEKKYLATLAETTLPGLRQAAGAFRTNGAISLTAEFARRLELASKIIHDLNENLPVLKREQLCLACSTCEYAKRCNG
jgi:hypothetical protein